LSCSVHKADTHSWVRPTDRPAWALPSHRGRWRPAAGPARVQIDPLIENLPVQSRLSHSPRCCPKLARWARVRNKATPGPPGLNTAALRSFPMCRSALMLAFGLLLVSQPPLTAAEIPGTDLAYANYRKLLLANGWRPVRFCGSPYPETCTGRSMASAKWLHPVDGSKIEIQLWPCRHGWCLAPAVSPPES
jgi:hypothetical protein